MSGLAEASARPAKGSAGPRRTRGARFWPVIGRIASFGLLLLGAVVMVGPFLWIFTTSLRPAQEAFTLPPQWLPSATSTFDAYRRLFSNATLFPRFFQNSLTLSVAVTLGYVTTTTLAGYAFARLDVPMKKVLFGLLLASLMVPIQVTLVPLFIVMRTIGLVDSQWSIILPGLLGAFAPGMSGVFGIFMMRQFFLSLPEELFDAARVDGASDLRTFLSIAVPLAAPQIAALSVIIFVLTWNDYFLPLIFLNSIDKQVLPLGIMSLRDPSGNSTDTGQVVAAISLSILPVLAFYLIAQRWIVESFVRAGVKG